MVYSATTIRPRVHVPGRWHREGRLTTLSAGIYHWYVWPIMRRHAHSARGPAVVATTFEVGKQ
jgi:hypothetical protein